jgi:hypothetical protein
MYENRDVADRDAGLGGDAPARRQLDRRSAAGVGDAIDLGDPDQPPVHLAADLDVEALTDGRRSDAASSVLGPNGVQ